ncbi:hypothetical protein B0H10DRAFT_1944279 [Mycena sp. CBHHK59/15]|nr:hypothetical protein B0H10DRAFT_1944279 [Mycena sp. CBHHK59/15]
MLNSENNRGFGGIHIVHNGLFPDLVLFVFSENYNPEGMSSIASMSAPNKFKRWPVAVVGRFNEHPRLYSDVKPADSTKNADLSESPSFHRDISLAGICSLAGSGAFQLQIMHTWAEIWVQTALGTDGHCCTSSLIASSGRPTSSAKKTKDSPSGSVLPAEASRDIEWRPQTGRKAQRNCVDGGYGQKSRGECTDLNEMKQVSTRERELVDVMEGYRIRRHAPCTRRRVTIVQRSALWHSQCATLM